MPVPGDKKHMINLKKIDIELHSADNPKFLASLHVTMTAEDGTVKVLKPVNLNNGDIYHLLFGDS
jgi:hypothetical protein